jgi:hypothetical protein
MVEGVFFHNFDNYLNNTDRVSDGQFVSIFKPTDKQREKSSTVLFYIVQMTTRKKLGLCTPRGSHIS